MKICLKCHRDLFDRDIACDKCGCTDIMDKKEYSNLCREFQNSTEDKQQELRQTSQYKVICKYKFIVDTKNTLTMRIEQSKRDKEKNLQQQKQYYQSIQQKARQMQKNKPQVTETPNVPKCPICQSTNLSKITTAHKVGKIVLFGVFGMGDNGKTWKCNNCGSRF